MIDNFDISDILIRYHISTVANTISSFRLLLRIIKDSRNSVSSCSLQRYYIYLLHYYRQVTGYVIDSYSSISTFIQSFSLATPFPWVTKTMKLLCNHVYDVIFNDDEFQQRRILHCVLEKNVQLADVLLICICSYLLLFPLRLWDPYFSAINLYDLRDQENNFLARNMTAFIHFHSVFSVLRLHHVRSFRSILPTFWVILLCFQRFSSFNIIDE